MKNKSFDTYYYNVKRGTATFVVGAGTLVAAQFVQAASADDVIPKWIVTADAPLPASGASAAMQPAQDGTASTGVESGTTTAADDAASVFLLNTCIGNAGHCAPNGGRGGGAGAGAAEARARLPLGLRVRRVRPARLRAAVGLERQQARAAIRVAAGMAVVAGMVVVVVVVAVAAVTAAAVTAVAVTAAAVATAVVVALVAAVAVVVAAAPAAQAVVSVAALAVASAAASAAAASAKVAATAVDQVQAAVTAAATDTEIEWTAAPAPSPCDDNHAPPRRFLASVGGDVPIPRRTSPPGPGTPSTVSPARRWRHEPARR
ncbi:hypothetical protein K788_00029835 [Paraburkholderia caribensis MBA4]|uniref:Uncharacterized protein n=1 Tax=Paraburkholderia caribensis MBA4 TaxID=1323664 RepID=A0A0P0R3Y6_9BURK|nr:hypothetical protein [Paraburkholderia caribensis]ALL62852.1 hypothetical protein K788_00029835 [Paraburkholderia caribensis MBA4]